MTRKSFELRWIDVQGNCTHRRSLSIHNLMSVITSSETCMPEFEFQMMENVWRMVADIHAEIPCAVRYTVHTVNVIALLLFTVSLEKKR